MRLQNVAVQDDGRDTRKSARATNVCLLHTLDRDELWSQRKTRSIASKAPETTLDMYHDRQHGPLRLKRRKMGSSKYTPPQNRSLSSSLASNPKIYAITPRQPMLSCHSISQRDTIGNHNAENSDRGLRRSQSSPFSGPYLVIRPRTSTFTRFPSNLEMRSRS